MGHNQFRFDISASSMIECCIDYHIPLYVGGGDLQGPMHTLVKD